MKKLFLAFVFGILSLSSAHASFVTYDQDLINQNVSASTIPTLNLNGNGPTANTDSISFQATYSSVSVPVQSFTDGRAATGSITINSLSGLTTSYATNKITISTSTNFVATKATDRLTVISTNGIDGSFATSYILVQGSNGFPVKLIAGRDWFNSFYSTNTAASIASALNSIPGIRAAAVSNVVYSTASTAGIVGNSYTLSTSTPAALGVTSANYTGGKAPAFNNAFLTVTGSNGLPIVLTNGFQWYAAENGSDTAKSISAILTKMVGIISTHSANVIYTTATVYGSAGNLMSIQSSTPAILTVLTQNYRGGSDNAQVGINGNLLTQGTDWRVQSTATGTAKAISDAIIANSTLTALVRSTWTAGGVVLSTALATGINYSLYSSTPAALTLSGAAMTGGSIIPYTIGTPTITISNNGFSTGLGVVYSTSSGVAISPLTNGTTYYVGKINSDNFYLATTATGAVAGNFITLISSSASANHTFTLTPQAFAGSPTISWQASNDGTNWFSLPVASVTYSSPGQYYWDGFTSFKYIRAVITAPSAGAWNVRLYGYGKND